MIEVPISGGYIALVDDQDVWVAKYKWQALVVKRSRNIYATRKDYTHSPPKVLRMHQEIMPGHSLLDHKNGNGLDNRRENLRPATISQNCRNQRPRMGAMSPYKGVARRFRENPIRPWGASIRISRPLGTPPRQVTLGYFKTEEDAALAYNFAAEEHFGEFARYNSPEDKLQCPWQGKEAK
jgi:hypothetical protein